MPFDSGMSLAELWRIRTLKARLEGQQSMKTETKGCTMILFTVRLKTKTDGGSDTSTTHRALLDHFRSSSEPILYSLVSDPEQAETCYWIGEWQVDTPLEAFLGSGHFQALSGALSILRDGYKISGLEVLQRPANGRNKR
jgi:hypothetical protein